MNSQNANAQKAHGQDKRKLRVLDLFSGIGGFSLGLERTGGFETVAFCEIEEYPRATLKKHWPGVPIYEDVRTLTSEQTGPVDVICGGYPCQPFSLAGKRRGTEDDRHLWPAMLRLIVELRPSWVIAENVAGHITLGLDQVLTDLENNGYSAAPIVIPTVAVGANHRRDRVWIIAHTPISGQQGNVREAGLQKTNNRPPKTLGSQHWHSGPFADWEKLMGEPGLCWMDDGIPSTVDIRPRLHAYGNAVSPQIVEQIGYAILAAR